MRILKYLLLLILLLVIGAVVFVATQKNEFEVKQSAVIHVKKNVVFSYVNDLRNWEEFGVWKDDDRSMQFIFGDTTIGKGAKYSWKSSANDGETITVFEKENDSIAQKSIISGEKVQTYFTFKDTVGGTKVTWYSKGKLTFKAKVLALLDGGAEKMIGSVYQRSLKKLDKIITHEINTYNIKVNGVVQKTGGWYFQQKITCKIDETQKNISLITAKMMLFFKENQIKLTGSPFVIYHEVNRTENTNTISVCLPMPDEIYTAPGSDYFSGNLAPYQAVKTTLYGDYSHLAEAKMETINHIRKNNLQQNLAFPIIEVYKKSASEIKSPSKWETEIFVATGNQPAQNQTVVKPTPKPQPVVVPAPMVTTPTE
ncbi:transcriptional regulator [Flavobacterium sp. NST-5]|uniref:Transcriptional regulator n=1 Tax=Flavobacterium ichthyis TaxID=2698827 RepID=A0ABW9Z5U8_9FLAO|nr:SRPBCC family protein [Flavobacterium ichthyis]NBL64210.1 transcriptional regulator [Flavobacterium ichthyis]